MIHSDFSCILEDNYVDSASWDYDAVKCCAPDAASAAREAVETQADELGLYLNPAGSDENAGILVKDLETEEIVRVCIAGSDENVGILVKDLETGEIVRVYIEVRLAVQVTCVRQDKNFIAPKE